MSGKIIPKFVSKKEKESKKFLENKANLKINYTKKHKSIPKKYQNSVRIKEEEFPEGINELNAEFDQSSS